MKFAIALFIFFSACSLSKGSVKESTKKWTLVVVPDTQHYSAGWEKAPYEHMAKGFEWIRDNRDRLNIQMVQGLGDITQDWNSRYQWERAEKAWSVLRGHVLYMPTRGNHDDPYMFRLYFPEAKFKVLPWWLSGHNGVNSAFEMKLHGKKYVFIQLDTFDQYSTGKDYSAIDWANRLIEENDDARIILATHDLWSTSEVKDRLLSKHDNIVLANAGHSCVRERRYKVKSAEVFIVNYQCDEYEDFKLRYYTFHSNGKVEFKTFSPASGEFEKDSSSEGFFKLPVE